MSKTIKRIFAILSIVSAMLSVSAKFVHAQTTAFTYQGRLTDNSVAANGSYDMQFLVYTAVTGGAQQGFTVTKTAVPVSNGVFTVQIDMSNSPFAAGENRFLEIRVRLSGSGGGYTTLTPRQQITSTPYAIQSVGATFAANAFNSDALGNVPASNYVQTNDSRLTDARTPTAGSNNYIQNTTTQQTGSFNLTGGGSLGGNFSANSATVSGLTVNGAATVTGSITGNGANISGLNATNISLGSLSDTRLSSNIPRLNAANLFTNNISVQGDFSVGGTVTGNGSGLTSLNAASVSSGTFPDARLSANIPRKSSVNTFSANQIIDGTLFANTVDGTLVTGTILNAGTRFNLNGNPFVSSPTTGSTFVGIGTGAGNENMTGTNNTFVGKDAGNLNTSGNNNTFVGTEAGSRNNSGNNNTIIGSRASLSSFDLNYATVVGAGAVSDGDNTIVLGRLPSTGPVGPDRVIIRSNASIRGNLDVRGNINLGLLAFGGGTQLCFTLEPVNSIYTLAACSSSIRYKKDVENFTFGLDLVKRLRPVTFTWKSNNQRDLGFVAEEVNAVEPLMTTYNEKGEVEGVKYDRISAALVNAVNEQQDEINKQKETIERQQKQIDALVKLVCAANPSAGVCLDAKNK